MIFSKISEKQVTRAIISEFAREFEDYIENDVTVIGAGPSGLIAAREFARRGEKTLLIECNNYLGGGFWIGGYLMSGVTFREPANKVLDEIGIPYKKMEEGLYLADGPHACSQIIAANLDAGVCVINMTRFSYIFARYLV